MPDCPPARVRRVAHVAHEVLDELGAVGWPKTSGGKGLHVVTPLVPDGTISWDQAKLFAETVAAHLADRDPSRYVVNMAKKKRTGRIFIDYLRNTRGATT